MALERVQVMLRPEEPEAVPVGDADPFFSIIGIADGFDFESGRDPCDEIDEIVYGDPHGAGRRSQPRA